MSFSANDGLAWLWNCRGLCCIFSYWSSSSLFHWYFLKPKICLILIPVAGLRASWPRPDAVVVPAQVVIQSWYSSLLSGSWTREVFPGMTHVAAKTQEVLQGTIIFFCVKDSNTVIWICLKGLSQHAFTNRPLNEQWIVHWIFREFLSHPLELRCVSRPPVSFCLLLMLPQHTEVDSVVCG